MRWHWLVAGLLCMLGNGMSLAQEAASKERLLSFPLVGDPAWVLQLRGTQASATPVTYDVALWVAQADAGNNGTHAFDTGLEVRGASLKNDSFEYVGGAGAAIVSVDRQRMKSFLQKLGTPAQLLDALDLGALTVPVQIANDLREVEVRIRLNLPGVGSLAEPAVLRLRASSAKPAGQPPTTPEATISAAAFAAAFLASSSPAINAWESALQRSDAWKQLANVPRSILSLGSELRREGALQAGNLRLLARATLLANCTADLSLRVQAGRFIVDGSTAAEEARDCVRKQVWKAIDHKGAFERLGSYLQVTDLSWKPESAKIVARVRFAPRLPPLLNGIDRAIELPSAAAGLLTDLDANLRTLAEVIRSAAAPLIEALDAITKQANQAIDPAVLVGARFSLFGLSGSITSAKYQSDSDVTRLVVDVDVREPVQLRVQGVRLGGVSLAGGSVRATGIDFSRATHDITDERVEALIRGVTGEFDKALWRVSRARLTASALVVAVDVRIDALSLSYQAPDLAIPVAGLRPEALRAWAKAATAKLVESALTRLPRLDQVGGALKNVALVPSGDLWTKPQFTLSAELSLYAPFSVPLNWPISQPFDASKHVQWTKLSPSPSGVLGKLLRFEGNGFSADCGKPKLDKPYGVYCKFQVEVPGLPGLGALGGTVPVTTHGIHPPDAISGNVPFTIVTPLGFVLSSRGFEVGLKGPPRIAFMADLTYGAPEAGKVAKVKGKFEASLADLIFSTRGDLVVANSLELSRMEGQLDVKKASTTMKSESTGVMKQVIDLGQEMELDAARGTFRATGSLSVFKVLLLDASVEISTRTQKIGIDAVGKIPFAGTVPIGVESDLLFRTYRFRADPDVNVLGIPVRSHVRAIPGKVRLTVEVADVGTASVELVTPDQLSSKVIEELVRSLKDVSFESLNLNIAVNRSKDQSPKEDDFWPSEDASSAAAPAPVGAPDPLSPETIAKMLESAASAAQSWPSFPPTTGAPVQPPPSGGDPGVGTPAAGSLGVGSGAPAARSGSYTASIERDDNSCLVRMTPTQPSSAAVVNIKVPPNLAMELLDGTCKGSSLQWRLGAMFSAVDSSTYAWVESDPAKAVFFGSARAQSAITLGTGDLSAIFGDESLVDSYVSQGGDDPFAKQGQPVYVRAQLLTLAGDKEGAVTSIRRHGNLLILKLRRSSGQELHLVGRNGNSYVITDRQSEFSYFDPRPQHRFFDLTSELLETGGQIYKVGLNGRRSHVFVVGRWQCGLSGSQACVVWTDETRSSKVARVKSLIQRFSDREQIYSFAASADADILDIELGDVWLGRELSFAVRAIAETSWAVVPVRRDTTARSLRLGIAVAGSTLEARYAQWRAQGKATPRGRAAIGQEEDRRWLMEQLARGSDWDRGLFQANPVGILLNQ